MEDQVGSIREAGEGWVRGSVLGPREGAEPMALMSEVTLATGGARSDGHLMASRFAEAAFGSERRATVSPSLQPFQP
jgi:hypothetical protein